MNTKIQDVLTLDGIPLLRSKMECSVTCMIFDKLEVAAAEDRFE